MSGDDIRVGDIVVCIGHLRGGHSRAPKRGALYRVTGVFRGLADGGTNAQGLILRECPAPRPDLGWRADHFRKLPPAEECFTRKMRELRPLETEAA